MLASQAINTSVIVSFIYLCALIRDMYGFIDKQNPSCMLEKVMS